MTGTQPIDAAKTDEAGVTAYLKQNPDFLVRHIDLLADAHAAIDGEEPGVVNLQRHLLDRLRRETDRMRATTEALIRNGRVNQAVQTQIHAAALTILNTVTPTHLLRLMVHDLPNILDVDLFAICWEQENPAVPGLPPSPALDVLEPHWLSPGETDRILVEAGDALLCDSAPHRILGLEQSTLRSAAFVRLRPGTILPPGLLVIGSKRPTMFQPDQATELVVFLARILEHTLRRFFEPGDNSAPTPG
ncbi:MAG: DUF484 family protein [Magnetospiraceae bacterium]